MTARNFLLLTVTLLLTLVSGLKAQEAVDYDHKIIAVLPFRTTSYKAQTGPSEGDSAIQQLVAKEIALGVQVQEIFYNAITADKEKLLVEVQDWRITDSLLKKAAIDFRKANYTDKQLLARLLKVDAVLAGKLTDMRKTAAATSPDLLNIATSEIINQFDKTMITVSLYDGRTGNAIWDFQHMVSVNKEKKLDSNKLYKSFIKRFPYTR